ncbi:MAG: prephenate dehydratase [Candidatus Elarobacter sp.]
MHTMPSVGYQGHPGAFSDVAARELVPDGETRGYGSFDAVAEAVDAGAVDYGVFPVENAIAGSIPRNYELLWERRLRVRAETVLRIDLCLIGPPGASEGTIVEIRSHPVALEQVRTFADRHPAWSRTTTTDTAGAVREVVALGDPAIAAIGPALAAEIYGGTIIARGVQDASENYTRFFLVTRDDAEPAGASVAGVPRGDRACVGISIADKPGSLRDALSAFADRGLDLRFLIARPDRREAFRYRFFCELTNADDRRLGDALAAIGGEQRILGRY